MATAAEALVAMHRLSVHDAPTQFARTAPPPSVSPSETRGSQSNLRVLGAGVYGTIFLLPDDTVMKAKRLASAQCASVEHEYDMHNAIYNAFQDLRTQYAENGIARSRYLQRNSYSPTSAQYTMDWIQNEIAKNIMVSMPIEYNPFPVEINGAKYECTLTMERLRGVPFELLQKYDLTLARHFEPEYLASHATQHKTPGLSESFATNTEIMGQLFFNEPDGIPGMLRFDKKEDGTRYKVSATHPSPGYAITLKSNMLDKLMPALEAQDLPLRTLQEIIGFATGWIFYYAKIFPHDIEIALGLYPRGTLEGIDRDEYRVNVMDFGLCVPNNKTGILLQLLWDIVDMDEWKDRLEDYVAAEEKRMPKETLQNILLLKSLEKHNMWQPLVDMFQVMLRDAFMRNLHITTELHSIESDLIEWAFVELLSIDVYGHFRNRGPTRDGMNLAKEMAQYMQGPREGV